FHVDAYGHFSICAFLRHPECLYDLRRGSLREAWEVFTPRLKAMRGGNEYRENCQACDLRSDCHWCPAYAYLEHQELEAPVRYLCEIAAAQREWRKKQSQRAPEETAA
ncbi:MAG: hypothetical protein L0Y55_16230, partial [Anaerolineales bacterium]|nr:hypothetical protein [Anaerolineales bacterium]